MATQIIMVCGGDCFQEEDRLVKRQLKAKTLHEAKVILAQRDMDGWGPGDCGRECLSVHGHTTPILPFTMHGHCSTRAYSVPHAGCVSVLMLLISSYWCYKLSSDGTWNNLVRYRNSETVPKPCHMIWWDTNANMIQLILFKLIG